jgi:hypothetical protein
MPGALALRDYRRRADTNRAKMRRRGPRAATNRSSFGCSTLRAPAGGIMHAYFGGGSCLATTGV